MTCLGSKPGLTLAMPAPHLYNTLTVHFPAVGLPGFLCLAWPPDMQALGFFNFQQIVNKRPNRSDVAWSDLGATKEQGICIM